jgi:hypothetical protein
MWKADPQKIGKPLTFEDLKLFREMFVACKGKPILPNTFTVIEGNEYGLLKNII